MRTNSVVTLCFAFLAMAAAAGAQDAGQPTPRATTSGARSLVLPLMFLENRGQLATDARFVARHRSFVARFHRDGIMLQRERDIDHCGGSRLGVAVKLSWPSGCAVEPEAEELLGGNVHSFVGAQSTWRQDLRACRVLRYRGIWPGVDLVAHDRGGELEYDLELAPSADLDQVSIHCAGAERMAVGADGALVMYTALGEVRQAAPTTWELGADGNRCEVPCRFVLRSNGCYGFAVERLDRTRTLVVDPVILWASYFGATGDDLANGLAIDASSNVILVGHTSSLFTFPATAGVYTSTFQGGLYDGFVAKLNPSASGMAQLVWCTFLGGTANDIVSSVAIGPSGEIAVIGNTFSTDFPTTAGALQVANAGARDDFVSVLSSNGAALLYSTYLGGAGDDNINAIVVEPDGRIDVAGHTASAGLPTSPGAFQPAYGGGVTDGWIGRLDRTASGAAQLAWGTYFGAGGTDAIYDLAISPIVPGRISVIGYTDAIGSLAQFSSGPLGGVDIVVAQLDPSLTAAAQKRFSHHISGGGSDYGYCIGIETNGDLVVAGQCGNAFPVTLGSYRTAAPASGVDGFVAKLTADGSAIRYATYIGTSATGNGFSYTPGHLHVATDGTVTIVGHTSWIIPLTPGAIDTVRAGYYEGFVSRFNAPLTELTYSTYIGGAGDDVVGFGSAHVAGDVVTLCCHTSSSGLTVQNPYQGGFQGGSYDGYLMRFDIGANPGGGAGTASYLTATRPVGSSPRGVAVHDIDQDGDLDIATANSGSHDVTLLRNDGTGAFGGAPETFALGGGNLGPSAVVAGDFDGDSAADDFAASCADTNTVVLATNAGSGAPTITAFATVGQRPVHLAAGNLDGNATTDLVIACEGALLTGGAGLDVVRNSGVAASLTIPPGRATSIVRVDLGDLDGDGEGLDLTLSISSGFMLRAA